MFKQPDFQWAWADGLTWCWRFRLHFSHFIVQFCLYNATSATSAVVWQHHRLTWHLVQFSFAWKLNFDPFKHSSCYYNQIALSCLATRLFCRKHLACPCAKLQMSAELKTVNFGENISLPSKHLISIPIKMCMLCLKAQSVSRNQII